ncbi:MAG: peptidoglycan DD-metalloendopeptidase family protein [Bacteroidales bacterium]|nr:peptidoglycan DD-metalloendopeptidase family protein [Bacteroidales bacterium]
MKVRRILLKEFRFFILLNSLLIINYSNLFSASKDDLFKKRDKILKDITLTETLLKKANEGKNEVLNSLSLINKKIQLRRELIENLNLELSNLEHAVDSLSMLIESNSHSIDNIKKEYAQIIYRSYFYFKPANILVLLLSAPNVSVGYRRIIYLKQYHNHRKNLINNLRTEIERLYSISLIINRKRNEKLRILELKSKEVEILNDDLIRAQKSLKEFQKRSKELQASLEQLKSNAKKIENEIRNLIETEVKNAKKTGSNVNLRKISQLSARFEQNKGKLPFPVEKGIIVSDFGEQPHPMYRGIKINNNGIDISTDCNVPVMSVFDGVVSKIFFIKGSNYAIILKHGDYYTVYQNLSSVSVNVGAEVKINTVLGYLSCPENEQVSRLHFELWQDLQKLDPSVWLSR